jgi:DNA-binding transcriptional regulator LsrR (DeoR family)
MARDESELRVLHAQEAVRTTMALAESADLTLVGVGQMGPRAPIVVDGFMALPEMMDLLALGAVGEITSWVYGADGRLLDCGHNRRVASAPLAPAAERLRVAVAVGEAKQAALLAALHGRLVNGLVTSEAAAERLLAA